PDVLIFDEATSHLDTATERAIQENLRTLLVGKTVVLVAHRLSTIKDADLIYVLRQGRVVEQGSHRQLLGQDGWYAALWRAQMDSGEGPRLQAVTAAGEGASEGSSSGADGWDGRLDRLGERYARGHANGRVSAEGVGDA